MEGTTPNQVLQVRIEDTSSVRSVRLRGEADLTSPAVFHQSLTLIIGDHRPIVVDFSQLKYLDMSGVRVLEEVHRKRTQRGQPIALLGSAPIVHTLLATVHVNQRIPVVESIGKALEFLQGKGRS